MDPLATVGDVEALLGRTFAGTELPRVVGLLQDASDLVRLEAGAPDGQPWVLDPGTALPRAVPGSIRGIVRRVVERAIRNPDGFSAESDGDYSYQRVQVQPGVYLTDAEIRLIRRACRRTGLYTLTTTRGEGCLDTVWFDDQYGCELFPLDTYPST